MYVPYVIYGAPLGLIALFQGSEGGGLNGGFPWLISLHVVFWSIFFIGAFGCKKLPARITVVLYGVVVVLLLLTLGGCARHYQWDNLGIE